MTFLYFIQFIFILFKTRFCSFFSTEYRLALKNLYRHIKRENSTRIHSVTYFNQANRPPINVRREKSPVAAGVTELQNGLTSTPNSLLINNR